MKPEGAVRLHVEPITLSVANEYVEAVHRHHGATLQRMPFFAVAAVDKEARIRGVAVASMPNCANRLTDGFRTMEVVRVATDGTPNACSVLYAACARAAKALGFSRVISYILDSEAGTSLRAAGWMEDEGEFGNLAWTNRDGRSGRNTGPKRRWSLDIAGIERPLPIFPDEVEAALAIPEQMSLPTDSLGSHAC